MDGYPRKPKFKMSEDELSHFWQIMDTDIWPLEGAVIIDLLLADSKEAAQAGGNRAMQLFFGIEKIEALQAVLQTAKESLKKQRLGPQLVPPKNPQA